MRTYSRALLAAALAATVVADGAGRRYQRPAGKTVTPKTKLPDNAYKARKKKLKTAKKSRKRNRK